MAAIAASVGLIPGPAQAADPLAPGVRGGIAVSDADVVSAKTSGEVFTSPANRTVRSVSSADKSRSGAPSGEGAPEIRLTSWSPSAHGVVLRADFQDGGAPLNVTIAWGDGSEQTVVSDGSTYVGEVHKYAEVGNYTITVTVTNPASGTQAVNKVDVETWGSDFNPHAPLRLLDTRDGTGTDKRKIPPKQPAVVRIRGNSTMPDGVTAVVLNVTVTNTTTSGHITGVGRGAPDTGTSSINYGPGETVPNLMILPVSSDGNAYVWNEGWESVDLIADITGYFTKSAASGYVSLSPTRVVDTREGQGAAKRQVAGQGSFSTQIGGVGAVPKSATAVSLNVTVTNPREAGHLTVHPSGQQTPTASNLNFTPGQTVANSVIVPVGLDGKIVVRNGSWQPTDVVIDINGYYTPDSSAAYMPPQNQASRLFDTRESGHPLAARDIYRQYFDVDLQHVEACILNATVTNTTGAGFLSVTSDPGKPEPAGNGSPIPPTQPISSVLNWTAGKTVGNFAQVRPGKAISYWNQGWENIDLIVDYYGSYNTD